MSGSVNLAIIQGRLGRDPEIRSMRNGDGIANLSIATSESWKDKRSGERVEKTEWHRVSVFNPNLVGIIQKYAKKGALIYVEGQVQTRKWTDQQGVERHTTEIVVQRYGGTVKIMADAPGQSRQAASNPDYAGPGSDLDQEIPF